ncbi:uncharacterized protein LOC108468750 [Gossypium arboreum]|uniref:uncharacterized protein LOC108468750 n=1 Tax=Gossypium arboreum TaxID=29729 RepID=UPI0008191983|nr:uncharacterized protein LOC108468750 [Gossypium arboreum]
MTQQELNLRQHCWIKLLKDYDCSTEYHPGKGNMVADALSQRSMNNLGTMFARLSLFDDGEILAELQVKQSLLDEIKSNQLLDESLISQKVHSSSRAIHPGGDKMYRDLYDLYWWPGLKCEVTMDFISGLPSTPTKKDSDWMLVKLYVSEIVKLHGVPISIISNWDPRFTSCF